jgi:hypothetical protein
MSNFGARPGRLTPRQRLSLITAEVYGLVHRFLTIKSHNKVTEK